jgi:hypothetical protein
MPIEKKHIFLCLLLLLIVYAPSSNAQKDSIGHTGSRKFGDLLITYAISSEYAKVDVVFQLQNEFVGEALLDWKNNSSGFDVALDSVKAKGSVSVDFAGSNKLSSLSAVVNILGTHKSPVYFKGELATWPSADNLIYIEETTYISPELRVVTSIVGENLAKVNIRLYAINELLYTLSLMQSTPVAKINDRLVIGTTEISEGATFTLTVPSLFQKGQVTMQCEIKSSNIPLTKFSSSIATWETVSLQKKNIQKIPETNRTGGLDNDKI